MSSAPTDPGKLRDTDAIKYLRVIDEDTGQIVQIGLIDTGNTTSDGLKIHALDVSGSTLTAIVQQGLKPDGVDITGSPLTMSGSAQALPSTTEAIAVLLKADNGNTADINIFNAVPLGPGEAIVIETVPDASWIQVTGTNPDVLHYAILLNSTIVP